MDSPSLPPLALDGSGGLLDGVHHRIDAGETAVVGRSRSCDISLRVTPAFDTHPRQRRVVLSRRFLRVSRVHCEISYLPDGRVEIRDLSSNGTIVDDGRIGRVHVLRLNGRSAKLELGDPRYGRLTLRLDRPED